MRVLVTGGTGYLGKHIVGRLVAAGHDVALLHRESSDLSDLPEGLDLRTGDVTDADSMREAVRGCEAVVHTAGLVRTWHPRPELYEAINVQGVANAVSAAEAEGCSRVVLTSSIIAMGATGSEVHGAGDIVYPRVCGNAYERTKCKGLLLARKLAAEGRPVITVCPGIIYGPGMMTKGNLVSELVATCLKGGVVPLLAGGRPVWCFAYVEDVAEGHRLALEKGTPGAQYVLGGENASLKRLYDLVEEIGGRHARRLPLPLWAAKFAGALELLLAQVFGREPNLTPGTAQILASNWAFHSREAVADLGYHETTLRDGIERTVRWLRESAA